MGKADPDADQFVLKSILKTSALKKKPTFAESKKPINWHALPIGTDTVVWPEVRKDRNGTEIKQGKHKIMFRDKVKTDERVYDVYLIESYKKYNASEDTEESIICKCAIFWTIFNLVNEISFQNIQVFNLPYHFKNSALVLCYMIIRNFV